MNLYLGTGNPNKIVELQAMLTDASVAISVFAPSEAGGMPEVVEDADTFSGNALKKARTLAALLPEDGWALADDSGLRVDALGGAPGVYSARYAGENATDADNCAKLLEAMKGVPDGMRGAAFECHLALVSPQGEEHVFVGSCPGSIIRQKQGDGGFGYDPLFVYQGANRTFAAMSKEEKAGFSHRGNAFRKLIGFLKEVGL